MFKERERDRREGEAGHFVRSRSAASSHTASLSGLARVASACRAPTTRATQRLDCPHRAGRATRRPLMADTTQPTTQWLSNSTTSARCLAALSTRYSTMRPPELPTSAAIANGWHQAACPWEETRHSGFLMYFSKAEAALEHAAVHACPQPMQWSNLRGHRFIFVGDSLVRQWTQSFLCRLRQALSVVADNMTWSTGVNSRWGTCLDFGDTPRWRHCHMEDGCVHFEHDIVVCFRRFERCVVEYAKSWLWKWLAMVMREYSVGERIVLMMTQGMHQPCNEVHWQHLKKWGPIGMTNFRRNVSLPRGSGPLPKSRIRVIYKDLSASHFPTRSGEFNRSSLFDRAGLPWTCRPMRKDDPLPLARQHELSQGLQTIRHMGGRILDTFDNDRDVGALLHATYAKVPSTIKPVDCLHWMLPGVPDVWTERLLGMLARWS